MLEACNEAKSLYSMRIIIFLVYKKSIQNGTDYYD